MPVRHDRKRRIIERLEHHGVYSGAVLAAFKARDLHLCPACGCETLVQEDSRTHDEVTLRCQCGWKVLCKPAELHQAPRAGHALVDACAAVAIEETRRQVALEALREGVRHPSPRPRTEARFEAAEPIQAGDAVVVAPREKPPTPLERRGKDEPQQVVPVSPAAAKVAAGRGGEDAQAVEESCEAGPAGPDRADVGTRKKPRRAKDR